MGATEALGNLFNKFRPPNNKSRIPSVNGGGVASGHGVFEDDDMIVSKPTIIFHTSQIFFNFLAMACFASVASFQAKWKIGPSGLSGFSLFVTVSGIILSTFMLMVPVIYEKYDKLARLARSLKEVRVGFILSGFGTAFSVLIAFIVTISAWTQPGCKNPDKDPHEKLGDDFKRELDGWCNTKKAAAVFMWLTFLSWAGTFVLTFLAWRSGAGRRPRDPPFTHPEVADADDDDDHHPRGGQRDGDEGSVYERVEVPARRPTGDNSHLPSSPFRDNADDGAGRYSYASGGTGYSTPPVAAAAAAAPRPSMDAYGAFSDPAPTGYGSPASPTQRVSRTMQYADPYAAVRASIAGGPQQQQQQSGPPSYDYQGYR